MNNNIVASIPKINSKISRTTADDRPAPQGSGSRKRFNVPGYQWPTEAIYELISHGLALLGLHRTAVLLFFAERTIRYHKLAETTSLTQVVEGIYTSRGDSVRWVSHGCGLRRSAAKQAMASLIEIGILEKRKRSDWENGNLPTQYTVKWEALHSYLSEKSRAKVPPLGRNTAKGCAEPLQTATLETPLAVLRPTPLAVLRPSTSRESSQVGNPDLKSSSSSSLHECKLAEKPLAPEPSLNRTEAKTAPPANGSAHAKPQARQGNDDDDEKPARTPAPTLMEAKATFLERVSQRHRGIDAEACYVNVRCELGKGSMGPIPTEAYLRRDLVETTNPAALTNPRGWYRELAKKMVAEQAEQLRGISSHAAVVETPRCTECKWGYLATGDFCTCALGKDLAAYERRAEKKKASAAGVLRKPPEAAAALSTMPAAGMRLQ